MVLYRQNLENLLFYKVGFFVSKITHEKIPIKKLITFFTILINPSIYLNLMAMLPDADKDHADFLDFMADSLKREVRTPQKDGSVKVESKVDFKKAYYKLQLINYPGFSRFVYEVERLEGMAFDCFNRMPSERAQVMFDYLMNLVESYRYSMDAKSSEIVRNKDNTQSSLTHLLTRFRIERNYSSNEEVKKNAIAALFGDKDKDQRQP